MNNQIRDFINGIVIGIANIIPGVSGGTMALVLGIYERLITGINGISGSTVKIFLRALTFRKDRRAEFTREFDRIEGPMLLRIMIGALAAIGASAKLLSYLLETQHDPTYGFFFGLVLFSAYTPYSLIKKKSIPVLICGIIAAASVITASEYMSGSRAIAKAEEKNKIELASAGMGFQKPAGSLAHDTVIFFSGAAAISAMILPGISGSFVLLMLGSYFEVLKAVTVFDIRLLAVFAAGCLFGLILFTKLLNFLLKKFYDPTMGFLLGLVAGSLWVIWPFRESTRVGTDIVYLANRIPSSFGFNELASLLAFIAGSVIVLLMFKIEKSQRKTSD
jgi:putative membrane protein